MSFDFPSSPVEGQIYAPPGGPQYVWNDPVWNVVPSGGGGGGDGSTAWADITGKPATFPPTLPIAQSGVTNLVTDLAAKEPSLPAGGTTSDFLRGDKTWAVPAGGGGGITDAPNDGKPYARKSAAWDDLTDDFTAKANLAGATFTGKVTAPPSAAGGAGLNIGSPHVAPSSPVDGDFWYAGGFLCTRQGGSTYTMVNTGNTQTITGAKTFTVSPVLPTPAAGDNSTKGATTAYVDTANALDAKLAGATFTGKVVTPASAAGGAGLNIGNGAAPTTPANGDIWISGSILQFWNGSGYINCIVNSGTQSIGGAKTFTTSPILPTPTAGDNSTKGATTAYVDAADALKANLAGATFTGKVTVPASTAGGAGINIGSGGAPSSPVDGDLWVTTGGVLTWQGNTTTYTATNLSGTQTISGNKTFSNTGNAISGKMTFNASDATRHRLNVAASTTIPAAPADGDVWSTASGFYGRVGGVTRPMSIHVGTTAPSSPITNDLWVDTT